MDNQSLQIMKWELLKRSIHAGGFEAFCNAFGYKLARHHKLIAEKLEVLISTPGYNLMICMQPGSGKSIYSSILFPSYLMGRFPGQSIVAASHTAELASKWGRACKRIIDTPDYQYIMNTHLNKDSQSADRFDLLNGSEYFACGVGGSVTGRRMDCLPGYTKVLTSQGEVRIDNIELSSSPCYVLSYDEQKQRTQYCRVVAVARRQTVERLRIRTAQGYVVDATGNHRIRVGDGWKEASSILVGDVLMCLLPRAMQDMSFDFSWSGEGETITDTVAVVERICEQITVYDLEVDGNHNFFANGVLVHNCGIIDDAIRSREDADSERIRDKIWDWYLNDFCTRAKPGARKMIINTRWHEDDLSGRILMSPDRDNWDVLTLPAIAETDDALGRAPGEVLWPEYITHDMVMDIKKITDARTWNALYQQKPSVDEGSYFKAEWIQFVDNAPKGLQIYGASDYAVSADRGDYTVHIVIGHDDKTDNIYVLDMWRQQSESNVWIEHFINLCLKYEPLMWGEESGQIMKSLNPFIEKEMVRRRCFTFREQFVSMHDKTVRARAIQAYMAQKRVFIVNRQWTDDFVLELLKFPTGKYDDAVDAFGLVGRMLDEMVVRLEKKRQKEQYEYKSGVVMLPGLPTRKSSPTGDFQKI